MCVQRGGALQACSRACGTGCTSPSGPCASSSTAIAPPGGHVLVCTTRSCTSTHTDRRRVGGRGRVSALLSHLSLRASGGATISISGADDALMMRQASRENEELKSEEGDQDDQDRSKGPSGSLLESSDAEPYGHPGKVAATCARSTILNNCSFHSDGTAIIDSEGTHYRPLGSLSVRPLLLPPGST